MAMARALQWASLPPVVKVHNGEAVPGARFCHSFVICVFGKQARTIVASSGVRFCIYVTAITVRRDVSHIASVTSAVV